MTNDPVRPAHTVKTRAVQRKRLAANYLYYYPTKRVTHVVAHRNDLLPTLVTGGHAC